MTLPRIRTDIVSWPGLDPEFHDHVSAAAVTPSGAAFLASLADELLGVRGKGCELGPPLMVRRSHGSVLRTFATAYHRTVETVVRAYRTDRDVQTLLAVPHELSSETILDSDTTGERIHLCRLDIMLRPDGGFKVLETNANCPGALLSMGIASRAWREFLRPFYVDLPDPLDHEWVNWMANWFIQTAILETGMEPRFVPLLRQESGNRLEMPGLAGQLTNESVEAVEVDPRRARYQSGRMLVGRRPARHAYLKLGIPEFREMGWELHALIDAITSGNLFVPNGVLGRLVGDNKLCLAVISDPAFGHLFDPADLDAVRTHIPWSRAMSHCDSVLLREIRRSRAQFVLKRPLDTKGRGVVIGREVATHADWDRAISIAMRENWLVQEFCSTTRVESDYTGAVVDRHDLSLGVTNGELAGVIARSSSELRLNVARSGRLHPVYLDGGP
jgi:hypothetical protein